MQGEGLLSQSLVRSGRIFYPDVWSGGGGTGWVLGTLMAPCDGKRHLKVRGTSAPVEAVKVKGQRSTHYFLKQFSDMETN